MQFVNNNSLRNMYVVGLSLFLGISIPQYFITTTTADGVGPVRTDGIWVSHIDKRLKLSPSLLNDGFLNLNESHFVLLGAV